MGDRRFSISSAMKTAIKPIRDAARRDSKKLESHSSHENTKEASHRYGEERNPRNTSFSAPLREFGAVSAKQNKKAEQAHDGADFESAFLPLPLQQRKARLFD